MSEEQGFGCFAHTVNLCVTAGFKVPSIKKLIKVVKKVVKFVYKSSEAKRVLKRTCNQLQYTVVTLVSSVATRWNSVPFIMKE